MPTLAGIRQRMYELEPSLGKVYPIASLSATTVVVTRLATGQVQSGKYINKWLIRPDTANAADRTRICSNFASSTGTLTHAGSNYADTTTTGEDVEIAEYDAYDIDRSVVRAMETCRFIDHATLPTNASGIYWLDGFSWIDEPSTIREVRWDAWPVLSNNRFMQQWNGYSSAGALVPDYWDLTGTFTRGTGSARGKYTLVSPDSAWEVSQTVGLLEVDVDISTLRGQTVSVTLVGSTATGSQATVTVTDGVDTTASDALPGTGVRSQVSAQHVISDSATTLRFYASGDNTTTIEELYLNFQQTNQAVKVSVPRAIKTWPGWALDWQQGQPLRMDALGVTGYGTRLVVVSERPYTPFLASRIAAGTADQDETDAPLDLIAYAALAEFFRGEADGQTGVMRDAAKADKWFRIAQQKRAQHLASSDKPGFGDTLLSQRGSRVSARGVR